MHIDLSRLQAVVAEQFLDRHQGSPVVRPTDETRSRNSSEIVRSGSIALQPGSIDLP